MKSFKQQGIALVTALLILTISTVVATQIFYKQQINLRRTFNQLQADQVFQLFLSVEQWAKILLIEDLEKNTNDTLLDIWAQEMPPIAAEGGHFQAKITDLQACFNLNNLVLAGEIQNDQIAILKNLLKQKSKQKSLNENLIWSLVDWMDADDEPQAQGAEWETYSQFSPPYRAANQALTEIAELYAVANWDTDAITALAADICVLPSPPAFSAVGRYFPAQTIASTLNINTMSRELILSLSEKMQNAKLKQIIRYQQEQGFKSVQEFFDKLDEENPQEPKLSSTLNEEILSVNSFYFMLRYTGWIGNLEQQYQSLLYRNSNKKIDTFYRSRFY